MAPSPTHVRIRKLSAKPIGDLMNEMRDWLDSKKIEPIEFKAHLLDAGGCVELELSFRTQDEASLFERQFGLPN